MVAWEEERVGSLVRCVSGGNRLTIEVEGRFDFGLHSEFRTAYAEKVDPGAEVLVDLKAVEYFDSSALGMLLLLREYIGEESANITIAVSNGDVRSILEASNFEKLFKIIES